MVLKWFASYLTTSNNLALFHAKPDSLTNLQFHFLVKPKFCYLDLQKMYMKK